MKKIHFFHSFVTSILLAVLMILASCDTEMTNEEILNSDMQIITHHVLIEDSTRLDTQDFAKVYAYIDKKGEVNALNTRILESSGKSDVDDEVIRFLQHANFFHTVQNSKNGKEVIFELVVSYYQNHQDVKFIKYDKAPEPVGGFRTIQNNIVYPEVAQANGIEGTVIIQAYLNENGDMTKFNIMRGVKNSGLNQAAIDALKKTKFIPAESEGKKVGVWISIPIVFKLK